MSRGADGDAGRAPGRGAARHGAGSPGQTSARPGAPALRHEHKNLFERFDIDPRKGPRAITERLRELAEEATTDAERAAIREAWEELTMHPARRLRAAFGAHPESRPPIGAPPPARRAAAPIDADPSLTLSELATRPSVAAALGEGTVAGAPVSAQGAKLPFPSVLPLSADGFDDDPILRKTS